MKYSLQDIPQILVTSIGINLMINLNNHPITVLGGFRPSALNLEPRDPPPFVAGQPPPMNAMGYRMDIQTAVIEQPPIYPQLAPAEFRNYAGASYDSSIPHGIPSRPLRTPTSYYPAPPILVPAVGYQPVPVAGWGYPPATFVEMNNKNIVPHTNHGPLTQVANHYPAPSVLVPGVIYQPVLVPCWEYPPAHNAGSLHAAQYRPINRNQVGHITKLSSDAPPFGPQVPHDNSSRQSIGALVHDSGAGKVREHSGKSRHENSSSKLKSPTNPQLPVAQTSGSMQPKLSVFETKGGEMVQDVKVSPLLQAERLFGLSSNSKDTTTKSSLPTTSSKSGIFRGPKMSSGKEIKILKKNHMLPQQEESNENKKVENDQHKNTKASLSDKSLRENKELRKFPIDQKTNRAQNENKQVENDQNKMTEASLSDKSLRHNKELHKLPIDQKTIEAESENEQVENDQNKKTEASLSDQSIRDNQKPHKLPIDQNKNKAGNENKQVENDQNKETSGSLGDKSLREDKELHKLPIYQKTNKAENENEQVENYQHKNTEASLSHEILRDNQKLHKLSIDQKTNKAENENTQVENDQNNKTEGSMSDESLREDEELHKVPIDQTNNKAENENIKTDSQGDPSLWNRFPSDLKNQELELESKDLNIAKDGNEEVYKPESSSSVREMGGIKESEKTEKGNLLEIEEQIQVKAKGKRHKRKKQKKIAKSLNSALNSTIASVGEDLGVKISQSDRGAMGKIIPHNVQSGTMKQNIEKKEGLTQPVTAEERNVSNETGLDNEFFESKPNEMDSNKEIQLDIALDVHQPLPKNSRLMIDKTLQVHLEENKSMVEQMNLVIKENDELAKEQQGKALVSELEEKEKLEETKKDPSKLNPSGRSLKKSRNNGNGLDRPSTSLLSASRIHDKFYNSLQLIYSIQLFERVFGSERISEEFSLGELVNCLNSREDVFRIKFKNPTKRTLMASWPKQQIDIWESNSLDVGYMHHISNHLKINRVQNFIEVDGMDAGLFNMIVFFEKLNQKKDKPHIMNFFDCLPVELDPKEAYRRMLTLSKQFAQILLSNNLKWKFENFFEDGVSSMFDDFNTGEYEKTFDFFGYYGLKDEGIDKKETKRRYKHQVNKDIIDFSHSPHTRFSTFSAVIGHYEYRDRVSPRIYFPPNGFHSTWISESNYMNLIKSQDFIKALDRTGISLNRVLTFVLILQLEEEFLNLELIEGYHFYYMAKVLYRIMTPQDFNELQWLDTAERNFLRNHYRGKYTSHLKGFFSRLQHISQDESLKSDRAAYQAHIDPRDQMLEEKKYELISEVDYLQLHDSILKRREYRPKLNSLDKLKPSSLLGKLKQIENKLDQEALSF